MVILYENDHFVNAQSLPAAPYGLLAAEKAGFPAK
jgi:hypothetical protein